jgi:hypothetical protein
MTVESEQNRVIEADPTKEFFIHMLVRDIPLSRAILDLVDNSIDGAHRCATSGNYTDFWVNINMSHELFKISDNCGGIPVDIAKHYAFRFGRPEGADETPGSIGRFGVGMKRTLFKLGKHFKIVSKTTESSFVIEESVEAWKNEHRNWNFSFKELNENQKISLTDTGTTIEITELNENVRDEFSLKNFESALIAEMQTAYSIIMEKRFNININGIPLRINPIQLLTSDKLSPAFISKSYDNLGKSPVSVKIYAGISERDKAKGGWYVFCNGRMVLEADQTYVTGWDDGNDIPKYHPIFAFFRGYVFFECDDAGLLPWTTTKTGVDVDSALFKAVKLEMCAVMGPVLEFLRLLEKERREVENEEERELAKMVSTSDQVSYSILRENDNFIFPKITIEKKDSNTRRIQYWVDKEKYEVVRKKLKVTTLTAVGEKTFDYFHQMECL